MAINFQISVLLAKDETLGVDRVTCSSIELQRTSIYIPFSFLHSRIPRKRAKITVRTSEGAELEQGTVLHGDLNLLEAKLELNLRDKSQEFRNCRNLRFLMNYHLSNGTVLTNKVRIPHEDHDRSVKIYSIFGRTVLWALSFFTIVLLAYLVMKWGSSHGRVYRAIRIDPAWIVAIGTGILVYLGVPSMDSLSSLRKDGYFPKLRSYLSYPEYYFDPWLVRAVRHWSVIFLLVILSWVTFILLQRYETYNLPQDVPPAGMIFASKSGSQQIPVDEACNSQHGRDSPAKENILESTAARVANLVRSHWSADPTSKPEQMYHRDINTTCVAVQSNYNNEQPFCVGDLSTNGKNVVVDWYEFRADGSSRHLNSPFTGPLSREALLDADHFVVADHFLNNRFREEWEVTFQVTAEDCESIQITRRYLEPDVNVYLEWLKSEATRRRNQKHPKFQMGIPLNNVTSFERIAKDIKARIDQMNELSLINPQVPIPHREHISHWTIQEFTILLTDYWRKEVRLENRDKVSSDDVRDKDSVPNVFLFSIGKETKDPQLIAISLWWLSLEHYLHYYQESTPLIQPLSEFDQQLRAILIDMRVDGDCRLYDKFLTFRDDGVKPSFCNSVRDVYADFITVLLLLEQQLESTGSFHQLIVDRLLSIKGNGEYFMEDLRNYLLLSSVTNQLGDLRSPRMKFFYEQFLTQDAVAYGCSYIAVMREREADGKVTPSGYQTVRDFGSCEDYFQ